MTSKSIFICAILAMSASVFGDEARTSTLKFDRKLTTQLGSGAAMGGKEGGAGSLTGTKFRTEAERVVERIREMKQDAVKIKDLETVLDSGVEIVPVPVLIHPITRSPIIDQSVDAWSNLSYIQLVDWKWEKLLSDAEHLKHDDLVAHELLRVANEIFPGKYNDAGYAISIGKLKLNTRLSRFTDEKTNLQIMQALFEGGQDPIDTLDIPQWDDMLSAHPPMVCWGAATKIFRNETTLHLEETYPFRIGRVWKQEQSLGPAGGGKLLWKPNYAQPSVYSDGQPIQVYTNAQKIELGHWPHMVVGRDGPNELRLSIGAKYDYAGTEAQTAYRKFGEFIVFKAEANDFRYMSGIAEAYGYCYPTPDSTIHPKVLKQAEVSEAWIVRETRQASASPVTAIYARIRPGCSKSEEFGQVRRVVENGNNVSIRIKLVDMNGVDAACAEYNGQSVVGKVAEIPEVQSKSYEYWFQGNKLSLGVIPAGNVWDLSGNPLKGFGPAVSAMDKLSVSANQKADVLTTNVTLKRAAPEFGLFALEDLETTPGQVDYRLLVTAQENKDAVTAQGIDLEIKSSVTGKGPLKSVTVNGFGATIRIP